MTTTYEALLPQYIDSTMMTAFRSCPRKFFHEFLLGLRTAMPSIDLHAGGVFATGIETVYFAFHIDKCSEHEALLRGLNAMHVAWPLDFPVPDKSAKTFERMCQVLMDYFETYPMTTDHVQPYFVAGKPTVEFTFAIPLVDAPPHPISGEPFLYSGRFDMLGEYNGRPVARDEKTSGRGFTQNWSDQWTLRNQFMGYVWASQQSGIDLDTVIVRGIAIQKTQIQHAEAMKMFSKHMISRWYAQLLRDVERMVAAWNQQYYDYNFGDTCTAYNLCSYMSLCQSVDPTRWYSDFVVRRWNPLAASKDPTEQAKELVLS